MLRGAVGLARLANSCALQQQRMMSIRRSKQRAFKPDLNVEPELAKLLEARAFNEAIPFQEVSVIGPDGGMRHAKVPLAQAIAEAAKENLDGAACQFAGSFLCFSFF